MSSTVLPLSQTVALVTARYLVDNNDRHSVDCRNQARVIVRQLTSNLYTAVSEEVLHQFVTSFPKELTGELLCALVPPHLKSLQLKKCQRVLGKGLVTDYPYLRMVLKRCYRLQSLSLDKCDLHCSLKLCDIITHNASGLTALSLESCDGVTDAMVQILLKELPKLKHLNLSMIRQITDKVFDLSSDEQDIDVTQPGSSLSSVDLSGCQQLTSTCIRHLTELCGPTLQNLSVSNTGVDCTILWYLSGYNLSTAGQLAVLANKDPLGEDTLQGIQLAELLSDLQNLQKKLLDRFDVLHGGGESDGETEDEDEDDAGMREVSGKDEADDAGMIEEVSGKDQRVQDCNGEDLDMCKIDASENVPGDGNPDKSGNLEQVGEEFKICEQGDHDQETGTLNDKLSSTEVVLLNKLQVDLNQCEHMLNLYTKPDELLPPPIIASSDVGEGRSLLTNLQCLSASADGMNEYYTQLSSTDGTQGSADVDPDVSVQDGAQGVDESCKSHTTRGLDISCVESSRRRSSSVEDFVQDIVAKSINLLQSEKETESASATQGTQSQQDFVLHFKPQSDSSDVTCNSISTGTDSQQSSSDKSRTCGTCAVDKDQSDIENACSRDKSRTCDTCGLNQDQSDIENAIGTCPSTLAADVSPSHSSLPDQIGLQSESVGNRESLSKAYFSVVNDVLSMSVKSLKSEGVEQLKTSISIESNNDSLMCLKPHQSEDKVEDLDRMKQDDNMKKDSGQNGYSLQKEGSESPCINHLDMFVQDILDSSVKSMHNEECSGAEVNQSKQSSSDGEVELEEISVDIDSQSSLGANGGDSSDAVSSGTSSTAISSSAHSNAMDQSGIEPTTCAAQVDLSESKKETRQLHPKDTMNMCLKRQYQPVLSSLDICNIKFDEVLAKTCLLEFFQANKGLKKLTVSWNELEDSLLQIIARFSGELQCIALFESENITSLGLAHLLTHCPKLQQLDLQGASFITDYGLMPIFLNGEKSAITSLQLSETNISDTSLSHIAKCLGSKLTSLELSWCEEITEVGLSDIASQCISLKTFHARQGKLSAESLIALSQNCTGLTCLNLSSVDCLTDDVIVEMATHLHQIKELDISWNSALTDTAISAVMCNCPLITKFYAAGLKRITEKPLLPIVSDFNRWRRCLALIQIKMRERQVLEASGDPQCSSDEEYEDLYVPVRSSSHAPYLRYLDLQYCDRMKDKILAQIVAICRGTLTIRDYYGEEIIPKLLYGLKQS